MNIGLLGDCHGQVEPTLAALRRLHSRGVELVLVAGDFGYFPHICSSKKFIYRVDTELDDLGMDLWFVDGNHEDHDALRALSTDDQGRGMVTDRIRHLPRGHRFALGGKTWMAFGGAVSIDQHLRTPGYDWWPGERPSIAELNAAMGEPVDVMITHDRPQPGTPVDKGLRIPDGIRAASDAFQRDLAALTQALRPGLLIHGHHHHRYTGRFGGTTVMGLGCAGQRDDQFVAVLDQNSWG